MSTAKSPAISIDTQYEQIASRVAATWESTYTGFKVYLQIFSAILGGSIWLRLEIVRDRAVATALNADVHHFVLLSDVLVGLLSLVCLVMVFDNAFTWWMWRQKLAKVTDGSAIQDRLQSKWEAFGLEVFLALVMLGASAAFVIYNPFTI